MKNILSFNDLDIKLDKSEGFIVEEYSIDINIENSIAGNIDFIVVKESNSSCDLDGYLDQIEPNTIVPLKYFKLKDAKYGYELPKGDLIFLDKIYLNEYYRGKNIGSKVLEELISYTKSIGINRIVLSPQPIGVKKEDVSFSEKATKLDLWYKRYGFNTYINDEFKYMLLLIKN